MEDMKKIPAFTVLKNGSILKNIFLLRKQPQNQESDEEILLVGRHPDCHITLEHPSISRYHLRIHSNPSSRILSIVDLSSVHGTWVSGRRIEPGVHVMLREGDTVKIGGSSRVYELHWVPLSQADNVHGQFYTIKEGPEEEETHQDEKHEAYSSEDDLECLDSSLSNMIHESPLKTLDPLTSLGPSYSSSGTEVEHSLSLRTSNENDGIFATDSIQAPLVSETTSATQDSDSLNDLEDQLNWLREDFSNEFEILYHKIIKEDMVSVPNFSKSSCDDTELENSSPMKTGNGNDQIFTTVSIQTQLVAPEAIFETESSDSLQKSEDELNCFRDNLTATDSIQATSATQDSDSLNDSEDQLNWLREDFSNEFEILYHKIIKEDVVSVPNFSKSSCDDTEVENSSPMKSGNGNGQIFTTVSIQAQLVAPEAIFETESSDCLQKSEDELNCLRDNLSDEFDQISHGTIKDDTVSVDLSNAVKTQEKDALYQVIERSNETDTDNENEPENQLNINNNSVPAVLFDGASRDVGCEFEQMNQTKMIDESASMVLYDGVDTDVGCEFEQINQTKMMHESASMVPHDDVDRDVGCEFEQMNEIIMTDESMVLFDGVDRDVGCEFEQMNEVKMTNESMVLFDGVDRDVGCEFEQMNEMKMIDESMVLFDGVDMGAKFGSVDHEITMKQPVFMPLPDVTDMDQENTLTPDISKTKEIHMNLHSVQNGSASRKLFDSLDGKELEFYTPDKENKNPNACSGKSLSKKAVMSTVYGEKEVLSFSQKLFATDEGMDREHKIDLFASGEDLLAASSEEENTSTQTIVEGSRDSINYPLTVEKVVNSSQMLAKKRWIMVVDTNSLLDHKSLKHLKLLEGIKGTRLFVPKIVVNELKDIESQDSFFKRSSEKVTLALKWINECMMNTRWWIHMDDEIVHSSMAAPEVLEIALNLHKEVTDQRIIILSNNITLKINAMAEGIICEAAEEFRESLVNPFSERFMWVGSSARGLTWSCVDDGDDIVRQKYHGFKGLKLLACAATS